MQTYKGTFLFINGNKTKAIIKEKKVITTSPLKVESWGKIRYVYGDFSSVNKTTEYTYTYSVKGSSTFGDNRTIVIS